MASETPRVESFVLRFVQDAPENGVALHALASEDSRSGEIRPDQQVRTNWHAVVVHVQTNEEKNFADFADAVAFISRYVPLGDFVFKMEDGGRRTKEFGHPSSVLGQSGE